MSLSTEDYLNISKTIAIFALAGAGTWVLVYIALIFRSVYKASKNISNAFERLEDAAKSLKEKIEHSTSYLLLISEGVKKLVEVMRDSGNKKDEK